MNFGNRCLYSHGKGGNEEHCVGTGQQIGVIPLDW